MFRRHRWITLLIVLLLAVSLAACSGKDKEKEQGQAAQEAPAAEQQAPTDTPAPKPTDTPVPEPTDTPAPEPTATPESSEAAGGEAAPSGEPSEETTSIFAQPSETLPSFRFRGKLVQVLTLEDGTEEVTRMETEGAFVKTDSPQGGDQYFAITTADPSGEESMTMYEVGENIYINTEGEWIVLPRDESGMYSMFADLFTNPMGEMAFFAEEAKKVGEEEINGIKTVHYRIDDPLVFAELADMTEEDGELVTASVDVWVAKDGNYIVKYKLTAEAKGAQTFDSQGNEVVGDERVDWEFELYDVGADIVIEVPEDAPQPGELNVPGFGEGEFPLPPDTEVGTSLFGTAMLESNLSEEEFIQFYKDALPDWTIEGGFGIYTFSKGDTSFSMLLEQDEETGKLNAVLLPNE